MEYIINIWNILLYLYCIDIYIRNCIDRVEMQGTFDHEMEHSIMESIPETDEFDDVSSDEPDLKHPRLTAMANVPWRSLAPANDRETQQRMREHHTQEAKYMALTDDKKAYVPKVSPYPEGPDAVFPGTSCYKITLTGLIRHIFVLVPGGPGYDLGWTGQCRVQSAARWIVPYFIYRNEVLVNLFKDRWRQVYTLNSTLPVPIAPPRKDLYNSTVLPPLPAGAPYPLRPQDSYYVGGVTNPIVAAPSIEDPVISPPFNNNPIFVTHNMIRPFPYNQDPGVFPQRMAPPPVYAPQAVPAVVVPGPAPGPAPVPAGRGRGGAAAAGRGAPAAAVPHAGRGGRGRPAINNIPAQVPPHPSLLEVSPPTHLKTGREGVDWISVSPDNLEHGSRV